MHIAANTFVSFVTTYFGTLMTYTLWCLVERITTVTLQLSFLFHKASFTPHTEPSTAESSPAQPGLTEPDWIEQMITLVACRADSSRPENSMVDSYGL
jgi:hypothetical protein